MPCILTVLLWFPIGVSSGSALLAQGLLQSVPSFSLGEWHGARHTTALYYTKTSNAKIPVFQKC